MQGWNQAAESNGHAQISPDTYKQASVRTEDRSLKGISAWMSQMTEKCLENMEKSQDKILQRCSLGIPDRNSLLILQSIHAFADAPSPRSPRSVRRACRFREWRKIRALLRKLTRMQMYVHDRKHRISLCSMTENYKRTISSLFCSIKYNYQNTEDTNILSLIANLCLNFI